MTDSAERLISQALDHFRIELPSWGFANTGTRFGKFAQPAAATSIEEKLQDAGLVHKLTGSCPTVALHVAWDFPEGLASAREIVVFAEKQGISIGSINPTLFEEQDYKFGSLGNPDHQTRKKALDHIVYSIDIARETGSRDLVLWFADGSNYPGSANIRHRKRWFEENLQVIGSLAGEEIRILLEYKPFEPAFYHTDIADWGMALLLARKTSPTTRVLVDTGHHYPSQNIEQIVAWLLSEEMLGGFHFNDRKYADDDLTLSSIDPYQAFRILHEIHFYAWETDSLPDVGFMIDQSHNLKGKIEAMIQTVESAQQLVAKAALVDCEKLRRHQNESAIVDAEECLREAYHTDVRPLVGVWRRKHGLPENPLQAFRDSGYLERISEERSARNAVPGSSYV
jgi:L-rhamnose isomerase/sugar isomerase